MATLILVDADVFCCYGGQRTCGFDDTLTPTGPDPPLPEGETLPLTYQPLPDIA